MNVNDLSKTMVSIIVAILVAVTVVVPIVSSGLINAGDPVSYAQNGSRTPYFMGLVPDNETVTAEVLEGGISVNGTTYTATETSAATWSPIILTDSGYLAIRNESSSARISVFVEGEDLTSTSLTTGDTIVFADGVCTISGSKDITFDYSICYSVGFEDNVVTLIDMGTRYSGRYGLVNSINDITIYSFYSSGENDTHYTFVNGELSIGGDYETSVDYDLQLKDGTTDIYEIHEFTITIGDETFVPYFAFVPAVVEGHADSGVLYTLVSVIPIFVVIGILVGAMALFFNRRT